MQEGITSNEGAMVGTVELAGLRDRARTVCQELAPIITRDPEGGAPDLVSMVLSAFARAGLFDFASLHQNAASIHPGDLRRMATVIEALACHSGLLASIYMVNGILGGAFIVLAGTSSQKAALLPKLRNGELELAFAMTEPQAGSDAAGLSATAFRQNDSFVLQGEKIYTTGAKTAARIIVVARLAEHANAKRKLSLFLVPQEAEGLIVEALPKLAGNGHPSCRVQLNNVHVAASGVLGGLESLGNAWDILRFGGSIERLVVAAMALGHANAIVERATEFAKSREQFGQTIATFQSIQHTLVDMHVMRKAMRLMVDDALNVLERGDDPTEAISMAKCYCSEQLQAIVAMGMRILGGRGYFELEKMARYYREAPFTLYAGGTVEVQKMLIARAIGLP